MSRSSRAEGAAASSCVMRSRAAAGSLDAAEACRPLCLECKLADRPVDIRDDGGRHRVGGQQPIHAVQGGLMPHAAQPGTLDQVQLLARNRAGIHIPQAPRHAEPGPPGVPSLYRQCVETLIGRSIGAGIASAEHRGYGREKDEEIERQIARDAIQMDRPIHLGSENRLNIGLRDAFQRTQTYIRRGMDHAANITRKPGE